MSFFIFQAFYVCSDARCAGESSPEKGGNREKPLFRTNLLLSMRVLKLRRIISSDDKRKAWGKKETQGRQLNLKRHGYRWGIGSKLELIKIKSQYDTWPFFYYQWILKITH